MAISIPIYFIKFWKYLHRCRTSKVDGSSLNTKQSEHMVSSYFQITKKPQAGWDNTRMDWSGECGHQRCTLNHKVRENWGYVISSEAELSHLLLYFRPGHLVVSQYTVGDKMWGANGAVSASCKIYIYSVVPNRALQYVRNVMNDNGKYLHVSASGKKMGRVKAK
jgi:hypothetical protein